MASVAHPPHLVVVEDEPAQRDLLVSFLGSRDFRVTGVASGAEFRATVAGSVPALALLDIGLPDESGLSLARWLRTTHPGVGIIMVTAAGDTVDRVVGLETGADDYIAKPFEARELLARVRSVLRRAALPAIEPPLPAHQVRMGRRTLDIDRRLLLGTEGAAAETLTPGEFRLLRLFADNPDKPLGRTWLLREIAERDGDGTDRVIDLRIARLRKKIETDPAHPETIRTVRGVGYVFTPAKA